MADAPAYRWLNREGRWLGMEYSGLELGADGALRLESLPALDGPPPEDEVGTAPGLSTGVTELPGGDVFFTDPGTDRLLFVRACDPEHGPVPCLTGPGGGPAELRTPRGLLHHPGRHALLIADSGNGRILLLDSLTRQLLDIWGPFESPISLTLGSGGRVYLADAGQLRALDEWGRPLPGFGDPLIGERVTEVAVAGSGDEARLLALDAAGRVHVLDADGTPHTSWDTGLRRPLGFAAGADRVYVGDNGDRRIHVFGIDGHEVGVARGYDRTVAALAVSPHDTLLAHDGGPRPALRLPLCSAYRSSGVLRGGPFRNPSFARPALHRVRASVTVSGAGAHFRLHVCSRSDGTAPDDSAGPFTDPGWRAVAPDAPYTLLPGGPGDALWVGASFGGDGQATPVLSQIRVDFDHDTWLRHLPAVYQPGPEQGDFLPRWLTLFESAFDEVRQGIEELPVLFDPDAAPTGQLARLAEWLAVALPAEAGEARWRLILKDAAAADARRGTAAGLRAAIALRTGVEAVIDEPVVQTAWWTLPGDTAEGTGGLGFGTVLGAAEAQGAVVGSTAVLDGSVLAARDAYAAHLFADVAHRFTVLIHADPSASDAVARRVRDVVDEEKPVHTTYHLCVVQPLMRLGIQDRLGIDTVIAGPPPAGRLGSATASPLRLGGPEPARIGTGTAVGTAQLTGDQASGRQGSEGDTSERT
ncbi:phage tail protein [Streptomyces sp. Tu102]|uniref:phage tail protein n=1 Tax=Streptomyces sp. Tu102 TaxID=2838019 RepID=UPI001BDC598B|nr:phage tail protein [Streptomyces sp. Tu102]MBT1090325.1 hypothetical protein [Streptomyces sp. Tu102]